mmetsp:Transcript_13049/g.27766  ORF Transcript_13049/g.27766 Transcript_13049/m.27766 type:complete len:1004 (-) Transcript_13049:71-3082(-)
MKFGEQILQHASQHPELAKNYIDYERLKSLLVPLFHLDSTNDADVEAARPPILGAIGVNGTPGGLDAITGGFMKPSFDHDTPPSTSTTLHHDGETQRLHPAPAFLKPVMVTTSHEFQRELNHEIQKAVFFVMKTMGELSCDLWDLMEQQRFMSNSMKFLSFQASPVQPIIDETKQLQEHDQILIQTQLQQQQQEQHKKLIEMKLDEIYNLRMEYLVRVGSKLLHLLEFVELSIDAVIKIVKKHDKFLAKWEKMHHQYRHRYRRSSSSSYASHENNQYTRLRRKYLPRFAMYSSDPNLRCLFLLAADAGDSSSGSSIEMNPQLRHPHNNQAIGSQIDGSFGGWDVLQRNLEDSLKELYAWEGRLNIELKAGSSDSKARSTSLGSSGCSTMVDRASDEDGVGQLKRAISNEEQAPTHEPKWKSLSRSISGTSQALISTSTSLMNLASSAMTPRRKKTKVNFSEEIKKAFFEPILYRIHASRRRLGQSTRRYENMVYAHEMVHLIEDGRSHLMIGEQGFGKYGSTSGFQTTDGMNDVKDPTKVPNIWAEDIPSVSKLSKFLNLASSSLYMCNYNIVAPTSGLYAKMLGFNPANAGIIIGMTPVAVIGSSVLYSWWSSYSYKRALIFASFCCMIGNIVYALALPCDSLTMVLVGRMLTGFGSARVINRRYIADYYSIEDRTSGMADFVSASAFGMAVGPGLAALLSIVAPSERSGSSWWTIETAPGYIMFVMWAVYLTLNVLFFEEPDRGNGSSNSNVVQVDSTGKENDEAEETLSTEKVPLVEPAKVSISFEAPKEFQDSRCNVPVVVSLFLLVLLKSIVEGLTSSTPTISRYYFGWGVHANGIYLAGLASLMLPASFVVAQVSRKYDDRELIIVTLVIMLCGILGFLEYDSTSETYSETRFIMFGFVMFVSCSCLEGPTMGLLSKTIPKSLASGVLNAGLLATEAGTIGRVLGDFCMSTAAYEGLDELVNRLFFPLGIIVLTSIFVVFQAYTYLQPRYEDEDEDD